MARKTITKQAIDTFKERWKYTYRDAIHCIPVEVTGDRDPWNARRNAWKSSFDLTKFQDIFKHAKDGSDKYRLNKNEKYHYYGVEVYRVKMLGIRTAFNIQWW